MVYSSCDTIFCERYNEFVVKLKKTFYQLCHDTDTVVAVINNDNSKAVYTVRCGCIVFGDFEYDDDKDGNEH